MRKPAFCICENKGADQLRGYGNREADQRLCFRYTDSTISLFPKPLAIFCNCTARFVWDHVKYPEDRFSHNEAHLWVCHEGQCQVNIPEKGQQTVFYLGLLIV